MIWSGVRNTALVVRSEQRSVFLGGEQWLQLGDIIGQHRLHDFLIRLVPLLKLHNNNNNNNT
jgi:hypothetical protein